MSLPAMLTDRPHRRHQAVADRVAILIFGMVLVDGGYGLCLLASIHAIDLARPYGPRVIISVGKPILQRGVLA